MRNRDQVMTELRGALAANVQPQVLIIGGGINGIGVYRDLAAQGVPALLVEQEDFCSGTSAAPSRLIHGGLRYLETGEFALVRESVEERNRLLHNAPHQVLPQPVWIPMRSWLGGLLQAPLRLLRLSRTPGAKGALVVWAGLLCYDAFSRRVPALPPHRMVGRRELRHALPELDPAVRCAGQFHDARLVHPERLALELVMDAERDCPASLALPWLAVSGVADGAVQLHDRLGGGPLQVRPRIVVNTSGAWLDRVNQRLGRPTQWVGGTRGSHLVLRLPEAVTALAGRMLYFETADHRVCLAYPLDAQRLLLGTTDLRSDDPDDKQCTDGEIDYLFQVLHSLWPALPLSREQIVFHYAGVRPLPRSEGTVAGAISRDHSLRSDDPQPERPWALLSLVGGKWTTYRPCAAQVADEVLKRLGRPRHTDTRALPIGGGRDWPGDEAAQQRWLARCAQQGGWPQALLLRLWQRHGTGLPAVLDTLQTLPGRGLQPLAHAPAGWVQGEVVHLLRHERVSRLSDVVLRRTLLAFNGECSVALLNELGRLAASELGWSAQRLHEECTATTELLRHRHGARL